MYHNRIRSLMEDLNPLPRLAAPAASPSSFMICPVLCAHPVALEQFLWQQWLYQCAYAEAQAVVRPSLPERDLAGVWN